MSAALIVDANLLCLLVVGQVGENMIERHKRLSRYDIHEYRLLLGIVAQFDRLLVTAHVLTECSNLLRLAREPLRTDVTRQLAVLIGLADEAISPAITVVAVPEFLHLGLTDAGLLSLAEGGSLLLTDDLDLYLAGQRRGHAVANFSHLREGATLAGLGLI